MAAYIRASARKDGKARLAIRPGEKVVTKGGK